MQHNNMPSWPHDKDGCFNGDRATIVALPEAEWADGVRRVQIDGVRVSRVTRRKWNLYMAHRTPTLPTLRKHQIQVRGKQNSLSEKGTFFRNDNQDVSFTNEDERLKLKITRNHLWNVSSIYKIITTSNTTTIFL